MDTIICLSIVGCILRGGEDKDECKVAVGVGEGVEGPEDTNCGEEEGADV